MFQKLLQRFTPGMTGLFIVLIAAYTNLAGQEQRVRSIGLFRPTVTRVENQNIPGGDYKTILLKPGETCQTCMDSCLNDPKCKAYTWVKPGVQNANAVCWLKSTVTNPVTDTNCISGIKTSGREQFVQKDTVPERRSDRIRTDRKELTLEKVLPDIFKSENKNIPDVYNNFTDFKAVETGKTLSGSIYKIEDVSPGPGSTTAGWASLWGKMLAISATGLEGSVGPPTSWSSTNAGVIIDHVAAADKDGNLVLFYVYPGINWKTVQVSEKTNERIAMVRPASWLFPEGQITFERIAAPSPDGDLLLFTWHAGSDWAVENLSAITGKKIKGPVTSWSTPVGNSMVEHIGARSIDNHFIVFWRYTKGTWALVDVTAITGQLAGNCGASWIQKSGSGWMEMVAMPDPKGDLILFTYLPGTDWKTKNLSQMTNHKVGGPATHWSAPTGLQKDYLAVTAPNGDLLLFQTDPIEGGWHVENITGITGKSVVGPVTNWNIKEGGSWVEHLGGRGPDDHLCLFSRSTGGIWQVSDVTNLTGKTITQPPTSWITAKGSYSVENIAAPSWDGHLQVFTSEPAANWTAKDASLSAYGRVVYAASEFAGIWKSKDYGMNWMQMTRPQPDPGKETKAGLDVHLVLDMVASPTDPNLVLAATNNDNRNPSRTGIYLSRDGGGTWTLVHQFVDKGTFQPVTQIIFAPGDPKTLYAAGGSAIAISTDRGEKWTEVSLPGISEDNRVWHIAMSELLPGDVRKGYACGDHNFWYSPNSGKNWYPDQGASVNLPGFFGPKTGYGSFYSGSAPSVLAVNPEKPDHVYFADRTHANGRSYFHPKDGGPDGVFCNIPVIYDSNLNDRYDSNEQLIWPLDKFPKPQTGAMLMADIKLMFEDKNSDGKRDPGEPVIYDVTGDGKFSQWDPSDKEKVEQVLHGTPPAIGTVLTWDSGVKFLKVDNLLAPRGAGEGSLWYGDFSGFDPANPDKLKAIWNQLPGTPVYYGGSTTSGRVYVVTHKTKSGHLVFFSNRESVHVSAGKPSEGGWHRVEALDASASRRLKKGNTLLVHVDPHALAVSPDFDLALKPVRDLSFPYNQNMELDIPGTSTTAHFPGKQTCYGRIWIANDGGIYLSENCGQSWITAQSGLSTLASHNIAVVPQVNTVPGIPVKPPALYFGTGDNDDFFSLDGGKVWRNALGNCGDCDVWYADPAQPNLLWRHTPRDSKKAFVVFASSYGPPVMNANSTEWILVDYPKVPEKCEGRGLLDHRSYLMGSRPIIQTPADEDPLTKGDYLAVQEIKSPSSTIPKRILIRAKNSVSSNATSWIQVGPDLPTSVLIVQASGGHTETVFYVGDGNGVWRWPRNDGQNIEKWQPIVPGGGSVRATRFFANPYNKDETYILDQTAVRHSSDGGLTWLPDEKLYSALTAGGTFLCSCHETECVMNDMIFDRHSVNRFALGLAGVFSSGDGVNWLRLIDTRALPGRPRGAFYDPITDPKDKSLYVAFEGRGIMRIHPIPVQ